MTIKMTSFTHHPCVSHARFSFCWWRHNQLLMTSQWPDNCDAITWIMISNSLDVDFIHRNIHGRSCKKTYLPLGYYISSNSHYLKNLNCSASYTTHLCDMFVFYILVTNVLIVTLLKCLYLLHCIQMFACILISYPRDSHAMEVRTYLMACNMTCIVQRAPFFMKCEMEYEMSLNEFTNISSNFLVLLFIPASKYCGIV